MNTADQLKTHLLSLNPPQSQDTFLLMIDLPANDVTLIPLELIKSIETVYKKVEKRTSSTEVKEVKLLNLQV